MRIGVPKEIKDREHRVALTPDGARQLVEQGHEILIQSQAGLGSGFHDEEYLAVGTNIVSLDKAWDVDLVLKVKEPLEPEYPFWALWLCFGCSVQPGRKKPRIWLI